MMQPPSPIWIEVDGLLKRLQQMNAVLNEREREKTQLQKQANALQKQKHILEKQNYELQKQNYELQKQNHKLKKDEATLHENYHHRLNLEWCENIRLSCLLNIQLNDVSSSFEEGERILNCCEDESSSR